MGDSEQTKQLAKNEGTMSERFTNKVMAEFTSGVGDLALTNFQRRLAQNYFIAIDAALTAAEEKRKAKKHNQDPVPVTWANVNLELLARAVVSAARVGLDPLQKNHVSIIPFKDNASGKYTITLMPGYRGIEMQAKKYGLDVPDAVIVELVYANDKFKSIKKDRNNPVESFDFEVVNDFDRGEIVGGFYYHVYKNQERNKLVVFSKKDIEKRKPAYASVEFWGGEKDVWEDGKKTGKKIAVEGWYEKMCWKTIYRAAYNDLTIDSQKIDDDYVRLKQLESQANELAIDDEIAAEANKDTIDVDAEHVEDQDQPDEKPANDPKPAPAGKAPKPEQQTLGATGTDGAPY